MQEVDLALYMRTELVEGPDVVVGRVIRQHVGKSPGKRNLAREMSPIPKRRKGMGKSPGGEKNEDKDPKGVPNSIQWVRSFPFALVVNLLEILFTFLIYG